MEFLLFPILILSLSFIVVLGAYLSEHLDIHLKRKQLELEALEISNKERAKKLKG
jgi:hypothetical protein